MVVRGSDRRRFATSACAAFLVACGGGKSVDPGDEARAGSAGSAGGGGQAGSGGAPDAGTAGMPLGGGAGNPAAGSAGNAAGSAGSTSAGAGGGAGTGTTCAKTVEPEPSSVAFHLPVEFVAETSPLELGAEVPRAEDGAYRAAAVAFFLSRATLIDGSGARVPARFVDAGGSPRPYDLLLVRAEDPAPAVDLLAPAGDYRALELGVGVPSECNHIDPTLAVFPLNASSGHYWNWATGYIFLRVEGQFEAETGEWTPFSFHVGFDEAYRTITLTGDLTVPTTTAPRIVVDVSRLLEGLSASREGLHLVPELEFADRFAEPGTVALEP
jgi:hypothetical protein